MTREIPPGPEVKPSEFVRAVAPQWQAGEAPPPPGHGLGRLIAEDSRDFNFPMSSVLPPARQITRKYRYWNQSQWWGDQGNTPQCVAFAWMHWLEDGPVTHRDRPAPLYNPREIYCAAQEVDEWWGDCRNPRYDGTSVRAGAKVLQARGVIGGYRWAFDLDTVVNALLSTGPVVFGTWWYQSMFRPDADGFVTVSGRRAGGHAYVANGVNLKREVIRFKNSWGRNWGKRGTFWMRFDDVARLIAEQGECCLATEISSDAPRR